MATITITITESVLQLLAGIPSNIILDTNVPATIFYTLDGSTPTTYSFVVVGPIDLPTNSAHVVIKAFATDGVDTSAVITQEYITNVIGLRNSHDTVILNQDCCNKATYPFGSSSSEMGELPIWGNAGGVIVDNNQSTRTADGYDGTGTSTGAGYYTPPDTRYDVLFSETNSIGETGRGIGTLPGRVIYSKPRNDNVTENSSNTASPFFNPKALVIFQDSSEEQFDPDIPRINRPYFDLENQAKARDGALLSEGAISPSGGFLKAIFNPTDNTLTYYYYDNRACRWIISKEPYSPAQNPTANLSGMVSRSRGQGAGKVFKWIPFKYRTLI